MKDFFSTIANISPALLLGWASAWVGLFDDTFLIRPGASHQVNTTAVAISTVLAVIAGLLCRTARLSILRYTAIAFLVVTIILAIGCYICRTLLSYPAPRGTIIDLANLWDGLSIAFLISTVLTVMFAILSAIRTLTRRE